MIILICIAVNHIVLTKVLTNFLKFVILINKGVFADSFKKPLFKQGKHKFR